VEEKIEETVEENYWMAQNFSSMILNRQFSDDIATKASQIRDAYKQSQYRQQFQGKNKSDHHCAHFVSNELAVFLNTLCEQPSTVEKLSAIVNQSKNFRMVNKKVNLSDHNKIDNHIKSQWLLVLELCNNFINNLLDVLQHEWNFVDIYLKKTRITLHGQQAARAKAQAKRIQSLGFSNEFMIVSRNLYKIFVDSKGRQIWNDQRNLKNFVHQYNQNGAATKKENDNKKNKNKKTIKKSTTILMEMTISIITILVTMSIVTFLRVTITLMV